jgi:hypothetical protein
MSFSQVDVNPNLSCFVLFVLFDTHVRINLDMLKTKHRQQFLLDACLSGKQPFVVDNTNVTAEVRSYWKALKAIRVRNAASADGKLKRVSQMNFWRIGWDQANL